MESKQKTGLTLEVGKTYRDGCGLLNEIVGYDPNARFCFTSKTGRTYTENGKYFTAEDKNLDLVEEVSEGIEAHAVEQVFSEWEKLENCLDVVTDQCRDILRRKNHDYTSGSADVLANFRTSEMVGIPLQKGILLRVLDKIKRIQTYAERGDLKVTDESVVDAIHDIINYMVLLRFSINSE